MCNTELALEGIAKDVTQTRKYIARIEKHLDIQNGRIARMEGSIAKNTQEIAVQSSRCNLISEFSDKEIKEIRARSLSNEERMRQFIRDNGFNVATLASVVALIAKLNGWW
jgi:hypothetical protein